MKYLLDVNALLAAIVATHPHYSLTTAWLRGKGVVLCPIVELGFLRIGTNARAIGLSMAQARTALISFASTHRADRIADDLNALDSHPQTSNQVTDQYLADLAQKHGLKLATLDEQLKHPSVALVT